VQRNVDPDRVEANALVHSVLREAGALGMEGLQQRARRTIGTAFQPYVRAQSREEAA
jgi:hypothetical protein